MADNTVIERLKKAITDLDLDTKDEEVGIVRTVGDGIVEIEGLADAAMAEMLEFDESSVSSVEKAIVKDTKLFALVLNLEEDVIKAVVLGDASRVAEGMVVR
ncbi:MAG: hypothetical protein ACE5F4_02960, partial [Candidatus Paceibacteria bacterium]